MNRSGTYCANARTSAILRNRNRRVAWGLDPRLAITQYGHGVWTTAAGLPQDSVRGIAQTTDGYLWIATMGGLARFDGVSFTVFNSGNTPVLGRDEITAVTADPAGGLWIGTGGAGVLRYFNGGFSQVISVADTQTDNVRFLQLDSRGVLWIGADGGLSKYDHGKISTLFRGRGGMAVHCGIESPPGTLWFGTDSGLKKLENGSFTTYTARDGLPADPVWGAGRGAGRRDLDRHAAGRLERAAPRRLPQLHHPRRADFQCHHRAPSRP